MANTVPDEISAAHLIARLTRSDAVSPIEQTVLDGLIATTRAHPTRGTLAQAGKRLDESQLLLEGFVSRQVRLADGRRQILAIHVPGDFVDLHSLTLKSLDHDVVALSPCRMAIVPHEQLIALTADQPHLTRLLWFATTVDAAIHRTWIAQMGRPAAERLAHLFCELRVRLEVTGRADRTGYALPITQVDLADATSLTPVHVNRTIRQLREAGLVDFRSGRVEFGDLVGLEALATFDPAYLYLETIAR